MPTPREGESRDDFVSRCMGDDEAVEDFPDTDQRAAFCNSEWERAQNVTDTAQLALAQQQRAGPIRREELFGRNHLVVPAVAVQEQVLHNNIGAMFLPAEEIEASVNAWNFTPVTLGHPTSRGQPVSARQPDVVNSRAVGILFNARFEDAALKVDVFIDPEQARNVGGGEELIAQLERGEVGEVSTGFSFMADNTAGEHDGDEFDLIARNISPDHFAVGIDQGACSVADGCGLGVNHDGPCEGDTMEAEQADEVAESIWGRLKAHFTEEEEVTDEAENTAPDEVEAVNEDTPDEPEVEETTDETPEWARNLADEVAALREDVDELAEAAEPAVNEYRQEREQIVSRLAANESCPFDEDELEGKGLDELRKLESMAKNRDYGGRGGPRPKTGDEIELGFDVGSPWGEPEPAEA